MKNKFSIIAILLFTSTFYFGQDDQTMITLFGRICQTDSIKSCIRKTKEGTDSVFVFNFKTPDANEFGITEYEFKDFYINFDTGSNYLFSSTPYGSIEQMDVSEKKAVIVIYIEGLGNRIKQGKFERATYSFVNKKYRWILKDVKYL